MWREGHGSPRLPRRGGVHAVTWPSRPVAPSPRRPARLQGRAWAPVLGPPRAKKRVGGVSFAHGDFPFPLTTDPSSAFLISRQGGGDARTRRAGARLSLSGRSLSALRTPRRSQTGLTCPQGPLHRSGSGSQLTRLQDKVLLDDDTLWGTILGPDGGLYVDEEDLMNAIKGFSSVTKEHTTFTDTHL